MYNKPQGITLFSVVIIEKNGGLFNLLTKYKYPHCHRCHRHRLSSICCHRLPSFFLLNVIFFTILVTMLESINDGDCYD